MSIENKRHIHPLFFSSSWCVYHNNSPGPFLALFLKGRKGGTFFSRALVQFLPVDLLMIASTSGNTFIQIKTAAVPPLQFFSSSSLRGSKKVFYCDFLNRLWSKSRFLGCSVCWITSQTIPTTRLIWLKTTIYMLYIIMKRIIWYQS